MVGIDEEFPNKVQRGDIIVGGQNFGCGSSREEAAASMKEGWHRRGRGAKLRSPVHTQLHQCRSSGRRVAGYR